MNRGEKRRDLDPRDFIRYKTEVQPVLQKKAFLSYPFSALSAFPYLFPLPTLFQKENFVFLPYMEQPSACQSTALDFHPSLPICCHTYAFSFLAYFRCIFHLQCIAKFLSPSCNTICTRIAPFFGKCIARNFSIPPCISYHVVFKTQ